MRLCVSVKGRKEKQPRTAAGEKSENKMKQNWLTPWQDSAPNRYLSPLHFRQPIPSPVNNGNPMAYTHGMIVSVPITVIETPSFLRDAKKLLSETW
jgi:hypothetical protein